MAGGLVVRLLGPLEVDCGGVPVGPAGSRRRSLFALLALRANEVCGLDSLVDGLWGADPPASAIGVVQTYVSTWRKALDDAGVRGADRIVRVGNGYRLRLDDPECDLLLFRALVDEGRRAVAGGSLADGRVALERALALWRGPALADLTGQASCDEAAEALEMRRMEAVEDWAELLLRTTAPDRLSAAVAALEQIRRAQPWRERVSELLMWALARQGRQGDALAVFDATRRALADELGVDPGPALRSMHERVLRQDADLSAADEARPAPALHSVPRPVRLDAFVGRDREADEVLTLLDATRLVTLVGPGGAGKTRLAEEVAERADRRGGEPVVVVELASIDDPALVPGRIAVRMGLSSAEPLDGLIALLRGRAVLLLLDNLEHLRGIGEIVAALLRGAPAVRILGTSRSPLGIPGEQQFSVPPLAVPEEGEADVERVVATSAVQLLVARGRAGDPHLAVTPDNAAALTRIVRVLDGLPLALEIVAPWLRPLTPDGVVERLQRPLDIPGRGLAEARHRTLRDAFAWSHALLSLDERALLARLSVLRGGGDLDSVTAVGEGATDRPVVDVLVDLVDRNLVQPATPAGGRPRFRMLETIRQFAAEQLAATGLGWEVADRAAEHYARWAAGLARHSEGPSTSSWLDRAVADADNLRAAIDHLAETGRSEEHLQLVVDTMALWFEAGHEREGERRLAGALERAPASPIRAIALAYLAWLVGAHDQPRAARLAQEAVELAGRDGDRPVLGFALQTLGDTSDDVHAAVAASTAASELAGELIADGTPIRYGPTAGEAVASGAAYNLAAVWAHRSLPTAIEWQLRALALAEVEGDRRVTAVNSARLGLLHLLGGDPSAAAGPIARATALMTGLVTARWEDIVSFARAHLLEWQGDGARAEAEYRELTTAALAGGRLLHGCLGSGGLADLLILRDAHEEAVAVLRRAEEALGRGADDRQRARLQVRQARLRRLEGRSAEAAAQLAAAEASFDPDALRPERIVWFVESALLDATSAPGRAGTRIATLESLSRRTGVQVPPWERRWWTALVAAG